MGVLAAALGLVVAFTIPAAGVTAVRWWYRRLPERLPVPLRMASTVPAWLVTTWPQAFLFAYVALVRN